MNDTVYFSQLIGPTLVVLAVGMALNVKPMLKTVDEITSSFALRYVFGLIEFVVGLALVLSHNIWIDLAAFLITLTGWMMIVEAVFLLIVPQFYAKMVRRVRSPALVWTGVIMCLAMGAYLTYFAYFM